MASPFHRWSSPENPTRFQASEGFDDDYDQKAPIHKKAYTNSLIYFFQILDYIFKTYFAQYKVNNQLLKVRFLGLK